MVKGDPGLIYAGSRVQIVWVGQGGTGPVYVGSRVRIVWVVQSSLQLDMLGWVGVYSVGGSVGLFTLNWSVLCISVDDSAFR